MPEDKAVTKKDGDTISNPGPKQGSGKKHEEELEKKLSEMHHTREEDDYKALAGKLNLPYSDLKSVPIDTDALSLLSSDEAYSANIAVVFKKDSKIIVATTDPDTPAAQKIITKLKENYEVGIILTNPRSLQDVFKTYQTV